MVSWIRGKVHYVKEESGLIWFHIYSWYGRGWISINKDIFEKSMKKRLVELLYRADNRRIERNIRVLEREVKKLRKEGKEAEAKSREYHIHSLRLKIKKDLNLHDLIGKKITLRLD